MTAAEGMEPDRARVDVRGALVEATWLAILLRVALAGLAMLVVVSGRATAPCPDAVAGIPTTGPLFPLVGAWFHWDACWYWNIAAVGYGTTPDTAPTAFFPLFPLIAGVLAQVRGNIAIAMAVVNTVALVVALAGIHRLVARDFDTPVAQRTMLYLVAFPAALFLVSPFSEPLFLAGAAWAFVGARERRWEFAMAGAVVAALARPLGVVLVVPIGWEVLRMAVERWRAGDRRPRLYDLFALLAVVAAPLAWLGFVWYSASLVGESTIASNAHWGTHRLVLPWDRIAESFANAVERRAPAQVISPILWMLMAGLTVLGIRRLPAAYWLYGIPALVLCLTQETVFPMMSTSRYLMALFPLLVLPAIAGRSRRFHTTWTVVSVLLLAYMATLYLQGKMVG